MILVKSKGAKIEKRGKCSSYSSSSENSLESETSSDELFENLPPTRPLIQENPFNSCCSNFELRMLRCFEFLWTLLLFITHQVIGDFVFSLLGWQTWKETPSWKENSKHVYDERCTYSGYIMQKAAIRGSYAYASMNKSQRNMAKLFNNQHVWDSTEDIFADNEQICHGCKYQAIDSMLMDCGHTVLCTTCAKLCTHCPVCLKVVRRSPTKIDLDAIHKYDYTRTPISEPLKRGWSLATLASSEKLTF